MTSPTNTERRWVTLEQSEYNEMTLERDGLEDECEKLRKENADLLDKALRFDLDQAGIEMREATAGELVEARAEIQRLLADKKRLRKAISHIHALLNTKGSMTDAMIEKIIDGARAETMNPRNKR